MKTRTPRTKMNTLLHWLCLLLLTSSASQADERKARNCRAALDGTADTSLSIEDKRLMANEVLDSCIGIDEPDLRARDALIRSQRMGSWASMRAYLEGEVEALAESRGSESPLLVQLYEQLITATLRDGCDVRAAQDLIRRATILREQIAEYGVVENLSAEGNWHFGAAACYSELGENKKARSEYRAAEQLARKALDLQTREEDIDIEQRMLIIDLLRLTLEGLGSPLDRNLFDEYEQLMDELG